MGRPLTSSPNKGGLIALNMEGWRDLEKSLRELGNDKEIVKAMNKALKKVAEPAAEYARELAPKGKTGHLAQSINVSNKLTRRQMRYRIRTLPLEAAVYFGPSSSNAHLVEFGTSKRQTKDGKNRGAVRPQPFMRPAWERFKKLMLEQFGKMLGEQVEKSAKRIARRQAKLLAKGKK